MAWRAPGRDRPAWVRRVVRSCNRAHNLTHKLIKLIAKMKNILNSAATARTSVPEHCPSTRQGDRELVPRLGPRCDGGAPTAPALHANCGGRDHRSEATDIKTQAAAPDAAEITVRPVLSTRSIKTTPFSIGAWVSGDVPWRFLDLIFIIIQILLGYMYNRSLTKHARVRVQENE